MKKIKISRRLWIIILISLIWWVWAWVSWKFINWSYFPSKKIVKVKVTPTPKIESDTGTLVNENTWSWEVLKSNLSKDKYYLISWISASYDLQSVLVWLYNLRTKEISYLPYDYYIWKFNWKEDRSLWYLSSEELRTFFIWKWINIKDTIKIDRSIIFDLFTNTMSVDDYIITYIWKDGKKVEIPIKNKAQLLNLLWKDNLNNFWILEQLDTKIINLLVKNNITISDYFNKDSLDKLTDGDLLNYETIRKSKNYLTIESKKFKKEQINSILFSVDKDFKYLLDLKTNNFWDYYKYLQSENKIDTVKTKDIVKKETLRERIQRLKKTVKKETLREKIQRLRKENLKKNKLIRTIPKVVKKPITKVTKTTITTTAS